MANGENMKNFDQWLSTDDLINAQAIADLLIACKGDTASEKFAQSTDHLSGIQVIAFRDAIRYYITHQSEFSGGSDDNG